MPTSPSPDAKFLNTNHRINLNLIPFITSGKTMSHSSQTEPNPTKTMPQNSISNAKSVTVSGICCTWYLNILSGKNVKSSICWQFSPITYLTSAISLFFKTLSSYLGRVQKRKLVCCSKQVGKVGKSCVAAEKSRTLRQKLSENLPLCERPLTWRGARVINRQKLLSGAKNSQDTWRQLK